MRGTRYRSSTDNPWPATGDGGTTEVIPHPTAAARDFLEYIGDDGMMTGDDIPHSKTEMYRFLVRYSTIIVATEPIPVVYPFLQRYFIKGVMVGGLKG